MQELRSLFQLFLDQGDRAFAAHHFEVAYHALAAALHCANDLRDANLLGVVQRVAGEEGQWIDTNVPDHRLSSHHAHQRGNKGLFASLVKQVDTMLQGIKVDEQMAAFRRINEGT